jgi:hypothetical protein
MIIVKKFETILEKFTEAPFAVAIDCRKIKIKIKG